jgi:hypothetical protein
MAAAELAQAETASALPAEPDMAAVETLVVDLQRRVLGYVRFAAAASQPSARDQSLRPTWAKLYP